MSRADRTMTMRDDDVVADYALDDFAPGKDRITLVFKGVGDKTWEPGEFLLRQARGRVTFEVTGKQLLEERSLVRPVQMLLGP